MKKLRFEKRSLKVKIKYNDCKNLIKKYELRHFKFKTKKLFNFFFTNTSNDVTLITLKFIVVVVFTTNAISFSFSLIRRRDRFSKIRE